MPKEDFGNLLVRGAMQQDCEKLLSGSCRQNFFDIQSVYV
jgi:hypothetical protein